MLIQQNQISIKDSAFVYIIYSPGYFFVLVAMLRDSISRNGPYLTKEAYKYALERVRNYVPSSKEVWYNSDSYTLYLAQGSHLLVSYSWAILKLVA